MIEHVLYTSPDTLFNTKTFSTKALGRKTAWKGEILKIPEVNFMEILNIKKINYIWLH